MFLTKKFKEHNHYYFLETLCECNEYEFKKFKMCFALLKFQNLYNLVKVFNKKNY